MNKLLLILWCVFFVSCNCISSTLKYTSASEIKNTPQKKIKPTAAKKIREEKPIDLSIKENKTEFTDSIIEDSTTITPTLKKDTSKIEKEKTDIWNELLIKHVNTNGDVNYKGFLKDQYKLKVYLNDMATNSPQATWSTNEKLVYYINLYNAATIKLILDNYPIKGIKDINKPWAKEIVKIGKNTYSLGDIEHKILRKMNEPRIHFAINCASYSCPKLTNKAFTASNLEKMLESATIGFINDTKRNKITENELQLSHIFKWYKKDFTTMGSLIDYINSYVKIDIKEKATLSFLKYDWSLNEAK